jgi:hypothetical protein
MRGVNLEGWCNLSRAERLDTLIRQNRGTQILPLWIATLEHACGVAPKNDDFVGLTETLNLRKRFFERVKSGVEGSHFYLRVGSFDELKQRLKSLGHRLGPRPLILFSSVDRLIGAVRIPAISALENAEAVWEVVGEDLSLTSADLVDGLCVEKNYYGGNGRYVKEGIFEITAWGKLAP